MRSHLVAPLFALILIQFATLTARCAEAPEPLRIAASLAYSEPDPEGLTIRRNGLARWTQAGEKLVWYGKFSTPGKLAARISVRLPASATAEYQLTVGSRTLSGRAISRRRCSGRRGRRSASNGPPLSRRREWSTPRNRRHWRPRH